MRSAMPRSVTANCRTGSASKNSLAMSRSGPSGTVSSASCQRTSSPASAARCLRFKPGPISTRLMRAASRNPGAALQARSASAISVPRPGPSSTSSTGRGAPMSRVHASAHHSPTSSPNICETSGAVVKSPFSPNWSRPGSSRV